MDDYDLHVAHFLVQGCDVWLNNPRKPIEASGTSGMKASLNGVPHLSIGDGWWAEGYTGENGWLIEGRASRDDLDAHGRCRRGALYDLLETRDRPDLLRQGRQRHPAPVAGDRAPGDRHRRRRASAHGAWSRNTSRRSTPPPCKAEGSSLARRPDSDAAPRGGRSVTIDPCLESPSPSRAARSAARRTSPSPAARRSTAATAGTRRSRSRKSSRANSRSSATSARTARRNTSSTTPR